MPKSPDAFRTISEVADWLGVQAHVLRFWESKFAQVKPIKRAGGRRYYRPADMLLLGGIKKLLHDDGLTIKGTQKLLREKSVSFVADLSQPLDDLTMAVIESDDATDVDVTEDTPPTEDIAEVSEPIVKEAAPAPEPVADTKDEEATEPAVPQEIPIPDSSDTPATVPSETAVEAPIEADASAEEMSAPLLDPELTEASEPEATSEPEEPAEVAVAPEPTLESPVRVAADESESEPQGTAVSETASDLIPPDDDAEAVADEVPTAAALDDGTPIADAAETTLEPEQNDAAEVEENTPAPMPSFRARTRTPDPASGDGPPPEKIAHPEPEEMSAESAPQNPAKPRVIDLPPVPPLSDIAVSPSVLSALARVRHLSPEHAREIKPHLARLTRLRASMANPRKDSHKD